MGLDWFPCGSFACGCVVLRSFDGVCCFELVFVYVGLCLVLGVGFWACDLTLARWVAPDWFGLKCWGCVVYGVWGEFWWLFTVDVLFWWVADCLMCFMFDCCGRSILLLR